MNRHENKTHIYAVYKKLISDLKTYKGNRKVYSMQIGKNKDRMPVLISDIIDFKYCYKRQKKKKLHNDQGLNPARSLTIIVIYAFDMNIISSVHSVMSDSLQPHESQHARPPCPSPTPRVHSNSHPLRW